MTEEKVLGYLNLNKKKKIDKSLMKNLFGFDLCFTWGIILFGFLLRFFSFSVLNIVFAFISAITNIVFYIWYKRAVNPAHEFTYCAAISTTSVIRLFHGYFIVSKAEAAEYGYPRFGIVHIIVLIIFLLVTLYMLTKFYKIFQALKTETLEEVQNRIVRKNRQKKRRLWWIPLICCSPMMFVRLFKGGLKNAGLAIGFGLWAMACIWIYMSMLSIAKYVVAKKYKVEKILERTEGQTNY
ncbi:MAG: hypothetical protein IJ333_09870 [Clostridia bacterium]|nr:hypothetical protein [Clostridia bacterium]